MAKQDNGYMGGFRGRLGTAVGYTWRGRWCLRSLPGAVRNPRSEAQQQHRSLFKQEVQLAGRFNNVLRRTMQAASLELGLTPCNLFVKVNQPAFSLEDGALAVDWASLLLASGPVAPVAFGVPVVSAGTILSVGFAKNPLHMRADPYDRVQLYVYCPSNGESFLTAPVYRRTQRLSVDLPATMGGREVQVWGLVQDERERWSETLYVGAVVLDDGAGAGSEPMAAAPTAATRIASASLQREEADRSEENGKYGSVLTDSSLRSSPPPAAPATPSGEGGVPDGTGQAEQPDPAPRGDMA